MPATPQPTTAPTLDTLCRDLDSALGAAINAAALAHAKTLSIHHECANAKPCSDAAVWQAWCASQFLGTIIEDLRKLRGRL